MICACFLGASTVGALDIYIAADGSGDYTTIQDGIDNAVGTDTVWLYEGTFTGVGNRDLDFSGKAITVRSTSGWAPTCVIDCESLSAGVSFVTSEGRDPY